MWLFPVFRKPLRSGSGKPLNPYSVKWPVRVFRNQMFSGRDVRKFLLGPLSELVR